MFCSVRDKMLMDQHFSLTFLSLVLLIFLLVLDWTTAWQVIISMFLPDVSLHVTIDACYKRAMRALDVFWHVLTLPVENKATLAPGSEVTLITRKVLADWSGTVCTHSAEQAAAVWRCRSGCWCPIWFFLGCGLLGLLTLAHGGRCMFLMPFHCSAFSSAFGALLA